MLVGLLLSHQVPTPRVGPIPDRLPCNYASTYVVTIFGQALKAAFCSANTVRLISCPIFVRQKMETHLSGSVSGVVLGEEDFAESPFSKQLVRNPHLLLGDLDLVEVSPPSRPPSSAGFRQVFTLSQVDDSLATPGRMAGIRKRLPVRMNVSSVITDQSKVNNPLD